MGLGTPRRQGIPVFLRHSHQIILPWALLSLYCWACPLFYKGSTLRNASVKIVVYVPTFNAGETTRGVELACALRKMAANKGQEVEVTFVQAVVEGKNFVSLIEQAGFAFEFTEITLSEEIVREIMTADHAGRQFISDFETALRFTASHLADLRKRKPDLVIYGFIPPAGIACAIEEIPSVAFLPFPAFKPWVAKYLVKDIPDSLENWITYAMPPFLRRKLARLLSWLVVKQGFFTQPNFGRAGKQLGWKEPKPDLFSMFPANLKLVNDLPDYYRGQAIGARTQITGPLFSRSSQNKVDPKILRTFRPENPRKVFFTMGSSGEKAYLLEAIEALVAGSYHAVVAVSPSIASLDEIRSRFPSLPERIYLTDQFLPAHTVTPMADVAIIHGGQGTLQTTLEAGVPFIGVAMQAEQQANLDNAVSLGAGIRVPRKFWRAKAIESALARLFEEPGFRESAKRVSTSYQAVNGHEQAAQAIWELLRAKEKAV